VTGAHRRVRTRAVTVPGSGPAESFLARHPAGTAPPDGSPSVAPNPVGETANACRGTCYEQAYGDPSCLRAPGSGWLWRGPGLGAPGAGQLQRALDGELHGLHGLRVAGAQLRAASMRDGPRRGLCVLGVRRGRPGGHLSAPARGELRALGAVLYLALQRPDGVGGMRRHGRELHRRVTVPRGG
jgi:hypothetical protein